jgi:Carbohydrate esterase, sialic acid-specific acetylesterase
VAEDQGAAEHLYGSCMIRMKTVSPANGTIRAVIFWQGGSDAKTKEDALALKDRFTAFVADLRTDLGNTDLPIIMVMLGDPDPKVAKKYPYWQGAGATARSQHSRRHQDRAWRTCSTVTTRRARCGRIPPTAQRRMRTI